MVSGLGLEGGLRIRFQVVPEEEEEEEEDLQPLLVGFGSMRSETEVIQK